MQHGHTHAQKSPLSLSEGDNLTFNPWWTSQSFIKEGFENLSMCSQSMSHWNVIWDLCLFATHAVGIGSVL